MGRIIESSLCYPNRIATASLAGRHHPCQNYSGPTPTQGYLGGWPEYLKELKALSISQRLQSPDFIRLYCNGIFLVKLGVLPAWIRRTRVLEHYARGFYLINRVVPLRVGRYLVSKIILGTRVIDIFGMHVRRVASTLPFVLFSSLNKAYFSRKSGKGSWKSHIEYVLFRTRNAPRFLRVKRKGGAYGYFDTGQNNDYPGLDLRSRRITHIEEDPLYSGAESDGSFSDDPDYLENQFSERYSYL